MTHDMQSLMSEDEWQHLISLTPARIALGRAGMSLPTKACLEFSLAHANARDAVMMPLDFSRLSQKLMRLGLSVVQLQTQVINHHMYLQRPDLGRLLHTGSAVDLRQIVMEPVDIAIVVVDGLSSKAIERHAEPFLSLLIPALNDRHYQLSPLCLVKYGRVAVGDAVSEGCHARLCVVLIGERPGLSTPDSMGIYFTYQARQGITTDADRNCLSNIHDQGLHYVQALTKLLYLIDESERLKRSGVLLKDESSAAQRLDDSVMEKRIEG
jgi:ethanolamine ammonia-lyase small subunit